MKSSTIERKKFFRHHGRTLKLLLLFCVLCLGIGVFHGLLTTQHFLVITDVEVLGAKTYVNKTDIEAVVKANTQGKSYFAVKPVELETDLQKNFLGASKFDVTKSVTGKVTVDVTERDPIAVLTGKTQSFIIDKEGYVLGFMDPSTTNLPKIRYTEDVKVGFFIDKAVVPIYSDIITQLDSEKIKVSSISMSEYDVRMYVDNGTEVVISRKKYDQSFAQRLKQVLGYLKTSGKSARTIDLRYDKVILSFN